MPDPQDHNPKRLVSVEFQTEVDLATAKPERRMFLKMYFDARDSGLLADIGALRWHTLCALATYMNEQGLCYPSQERLGKDLGVARENVNRRIKDLLTYRFQGRPVIVVQKARLSTKDGGRWSNNVYQILPVTGFGIFGGDDQETTKSPSPRRASPSVTKTSHRPVSQERHTGERHTNKNQVINQNVDVDVRVTPQGRTEGRGLVGLADLLKAIPSPTPPAPTTSQRLDPDRLDELAYLAADLLNDHKEISLRTFRRIAAQLGEAGFRRALDQANAAAKDNLIRGTKARYFMGVVKETARAQGLDLGLRSSEVRSA